MKWLFILLLVVSVSILLLTFFLNGINSQQIEAKNGTLDLRDWDFEKNGSVQLRGEWEFYWKRFVSHDELNGSEPAVPDGYISLPGNWENRRMGNDLLPREGYGSFRLTVLLKKADQEMAFRLLEQTNPLVLYVNSRKITSVGSVGTSFETAVNDSNPHLAYFSPDDEILDIIIHVSNYHYRKLAGQKIMTLGNANVMNKAYTKEIILELFLFGCFFIIGLYHLIVFIILKEKRMYNLFFGLIAFLWILRHLLIGNCSINFFITITSWELRRKLIAFVLYSLVFCFVQYICSLYPRLVLKKTYNIILAAGGLIFFVYILLPTNLFMQYSYYFIFILQYMVVILFIGFIINIIKINRLKKDTSTLAFTVSILVIIFSVFIEVVSFYVSPDLQYTSFFVILLFISFQTYININHFKSLKRTAVKLQNELIEKNLENINLRENQMKKCMERLNFMLRNKEITQRENDVITGIIKNKTNAEIADELYISYFTVRRHINNIYKKLDLKDRINLIKFLIRN
ncbi:MAG: hypothetical protein JXJ04_05485 [Spirochaetales bacterium]|nr:hypothetical protein [Spirochaetales bacterium]